MDTSNAKAIPLRINLAISCSLVFVHGLVLLVLPALSTISTGVLFGFVAVAALASPTLWALIHEAIHGLLLPSRTANDRLARLLGILFGAPFRAVRFAHLRHHRYNRTPWGREEVYDPALQSAPAAYAWHYLRITCALYVGELAISLFCWLPKSVLRPRLHALCPDHDGAAGMSAIIDRDVLSRHALAEIRADAACVLSLYGLAFTLYGTRWPLLAIMLAVRAFIASQLDHAPHHATPLGRRDHALNMHAPSWLRGALLNFNLHRAHHRNPQLPWRALPQFAEFEADDVTLARGVARQWRGPIPFSTRNK